MPKGLDLNWTQTRDIIYAASMWMISPLSQVLKHYACILTHQCTYCRWKAAQEHFPYMSFVSQIKSMNIITLAEILCYTSNAPTFTQFQPVIKEPRELQQQLFNCQLDLSACYAIVPSVYLRNKAAGFLPTSGKHILNYFSWKINDNKFMVQEENNRSKNYGTA